MALTQIPKDRTIAGLRELWGEIDELIGDLTPEQLRLPTPVPEWDVAANVAHIFGTEGMLLGEDPPITVDTDSLGYVRNDIGALNEHWVASFADASRDELLAAFRDFTERRLAVLEAMPDDEWNAESFTPAGPDSYGRFMRIRLFDCWVHAQDIRFAIGRPGGDQGLPTELALDEMQVALGLVVGKRAAAPDGSSVTFDLVGPAARQVHVVVDGRAAVVPELSGPATVTLTMPVVTFAMLCGGRDNAAEQRRLVEIAGDRALGESVLEHLGYMI